MCVRALEHNSMKFLKEKVKYMWFKT